MIFINWSLTYTETIDVNSSFTVCTVHTSRHSLTHETSNGTNDLNGFLIDDNAPIKFVGDKGPDGNYRSGNVSIQFENSMLNLFLGEWADLKAALNGAKAIAKKGDTIDGLPVDTWADESEKVFKLRQMQSSMMLDSSDDIKVRIKNKKKDWF